MNKPIFRCQFGSHVYGTNLPTSDRDFKGVFVPDAKDLILQKAAKHIDLSTKTDPSAKNLPTDVDDESFSVGEFIKLLLQGQTVALDMLFSPKEFIIEDSPAWYSIWGYRHKLLHRGTSAFVGYTKAQAAKYGVKGFRVAAVRSALNMLSILTMPGLRLNEVPHVLEVAVKQLGNEHVQIVEIDGAHGKKEPALDVCGRKIPFHARVDYAREVLQRIYDNYGARAKMAEENQGVDWKALMHAVRVAHEAEELLLTGHITFPRPERELLLKIRNGEMNYKDVEPIIDEGLIRVEAAQAKSILPEKPDFEFADKLVYALHREVIENHLKSP